jgi:hypothetical protein
MKMFFGFHHGDSIDVVFGALALKSDGHSLKVQTQHCAVEIRYVEIVLPQIPS